MIRLLIQWVAIALGLTTIPFGIMLMTIDNNDPSEVAGAMAAVIILCSVVWFICHELEGE